MNLTWGKRLFVVTVLCLQRISASNSGDFGPSDALHLHEQAEVTDAPVEFDFDDDEDIADDSGPLAPSVPEPLSRLERLQELISRPRPERSSGYLLRTRKDQVRNRKGGYLFRTKKDHQHPHLYFQEPLYNAYGDDVGDGEQVGLHQDKRGEGYLFRTRKSEARNNDEDVKRGGNYLFRTRKSSTGGKGYLFRTRKRTGNYLFRTRKADEDLAKRANYLFRTRKSKYLKRQNQGGYLFRT